MGSSSQPLASFAMADPDLVRYRLVGGFGDIGFTGGIGLDGEGSGAESRTGSFRRLFLRFEGDEDLAPRVQDDRRLGRRGSSRRRTTCENGVL
ncbi:hypothetical protein AAG906_016833 [Vitis piasezkii]